jgi:phosphatidylglycerol---prolipoprotein diacylglyceryl transferase
LVRRVDHALGVVLGTLWTVRLAKARGLDPEWILDMGIWFAIAGVIGARFAYVLTSPGAYFGPGGNPLAAFAVWEGGVSIHGAVAGIIGVLVWQARKKGYDAWRYLDVLMPIMAFWDHRGAPGELHERHRHRRPPDGLGDRLHLAGARDADARRVRPDRVRGALWTGAPPACHGLIALGQPCVVHLTQMYGAVVGVLLIGVIVWALRAPALARWRRAPRGDLVLRAAERHRGALPRQPALLEPLPRPGRRRGPLTATQLASVPIVLVSLYLLLTRPSKDEDVPLVRRAVAKPTAKRMEPQGPVTRAPAVAARAGGRPRHAHALERAEGPPRGRGRAGPRARAARELRGAAAVRRRRRATAPTPCARASRRTMGPTASSVEFALQSEQLGTGHALRGVRRARRLVRPRARRERRRRPARGRDAAGACSPQHQGGATA